MPNVNYQKTPPIQEEEFIIRLNGEPYGKEALRRGMERFAVKRGLEKKIGGNAGLARLATNYFDNIEVNAEGVFTGSFAILTGITGYFGNDGKLVMDVNQMKGEDLSAFLSAEGGREQAMESRRRWSSFLDEATGYSPKQRGDKAKEDAKKFSKAKSAIKMAHKMMEMSTSIDQETIEKANTMIAELQEMIDSGNPPSEGRVKKLNDLI
ncbi:MAG: hypothetical protein DWC09_08275 [Candidatus Poseidoniales archaeon]|nr:MAG: hypothetical protein DWC09_08275 [Candidatus Poseidoniales archaeon]